MQLGQSLDWVSAQQLYHDAMMSTSSLCRVSQSQAMPPLSRVQPHRGTRVKPIYMQKVSQTRLAALPLVHRTKHE